MIMQTLEPPALKCQQGTYVRKVVHSCQTVGEAELAVLVAAVGSHVVPLGAKGRPLHGSPLLLAGHGDGNTGGKCLGVWVYLEYVNGT